MAAGQYTKVLKSGTISETPVIWFEKMDLQLPLQEKLWRKVYLYIDSSTVAPTMDYSCYTAAGGTVTGSATGFDHGGGRWMFRFGFGARGRYADLKFTLTDMAFNDSVRPPLEVDYSPGRRPT